MLTIALDRSRTITSTLSGVIVPDDLPVYAFRAVPVLPTPKDALLQYMPAPVHATNFVQALQVDLAYNPKLLCIGGDVSIAFELNRMLHYFMRRADRKSQTLAQEPVIPFVVVQSPTVPNNMAIAHKEFSNNSSRLTSPAPSSLFPSISDTSIPTSGRPTPPLPHCDAYTFNFSQAVKTWPAPIQSRVPITRHQRTSLPKPEPGVAFRPCPAVSLTVADLEIIKRLGDGAFGKVHLARVRATGQLVALKTISKYIMAAQKNPDTDVLAEQRVMKALNGVTGALPLLASWHDGTHWYFVTAYIENGDLNDQMNRKGRLSSKRAQFYAAQILDTLDKCHAKNVIHRDVKPDNILIDHAGNAILADFGISRLFDAPRLPSDTGSLTEAQLNLTRHNTGTLPYMAPEVIKQESYSYEVDLWSLGVLVYEMLTGTHPFYNNDHVAPMAMADAIINNPFESRALDEIDPAAQDFVYQVLKKVPAHRPTLHQMKSHPFFFGIDWNAISTRTARAPHVPRKPTHRVKADGSALRGGKAYLPNYDPHPEFTWISPRFDLVTRHSNPHPFRTKTNTNVLRKLFSRNNLWKASAIPSPIFAPANATAPATKLDWTSKAKVVWKAAVLGPFKK